VLGSPCGRLSDGCLRPADPPRRNQSAFQAFADHDDRTPEKESILVSGACKVLGWGTPDSRVTIYVLFGTLPRQALWS
jgi:hypothetical protein